MKEKLKQEPPTIRVSLDLTEHGARNIIVYADSPEARDEGIERLRRCLPQLELLESALTGQAVE